MQGEFPDGPVVRTWCFPAMHRVQSLVGEVRSCKPHGASENILKTVIEDSLPFIQIVMLLPNLEEKYTHLYVGNLFLMSRLIFLRIFLYIVCCPVLFCQVLASL